MKTQVNPEFWSGSEILVWPRCSDPVHNTGCNGCHVAWSLTNVTRASGNDVKKQNGWLVCAAYFKVKNVINSSVCTNKYARKRIYHYCKVQIDKSVPRVTVWHHEAEPRDAKTETLGTYLSIHTSHSCQILIIPLLPNTENFKPLALWTYQYFPPEGEQRDILGSRQFWKNWCLILHPWRQVFSQHGSQITATMWGKIFLALFSKWRRRKACALIFLYQFLLFFDWLYNRILYTYWVQHLNDL